MLRRTTHTVVASPSLVSAPSLSLYREGDSPHRESTIQPDEQLEDLPWHPTSVASDHELSLTAPNSVHPGGG